jgi:hypothetical protein
LLTISYASLRGLSRNREGQKGNLTALRKFGRTPERVGWLRSYEAEPYEEIFFAISLMCSASLPSRAAEAVVATASDLGFAVKENSQTIPT